MVSDEAIILLRRAKHNIACSAACLGRNLPSLLTSSSHSVTPHTHSCCVGHLHGLVFWPITAWHWLEGRQPADLVAAAVTADQECPQIHSKVRMGAGHELAPSSC